MLTDLHFQQVLGTYGKTIWWQKTSGERKEAGGFRQVELRSCHPVCGMPWLGKEQQPSSFNRVNREEISYQWNFQQSQYVYYCVLNNSRGHHWYCHLFEGNQMAPPGRHLRWGSQSSWHCSRASLCGHMLRSWLTHSMSSFSLIKMLSLCYS